MDVLFHPISVSALTARPQVLLRTGVQHLAMSRELLTEAQRVQWAKDHCGRTWEQLGAAIGCSHSALSLWGTGKTALGNAKVHLVLAFARETGVNLEWLLTGDGSAISSYAVNEHPIVGQARHLVEERPGLADAGYELLRTLSGVPETGKPKR